MTACQGPRFLTHAAADEAAKTLGDKTVPYCCDHHWHITATRWREPYHDPPPAPLKPAPRPAATEWTHAALLAENAALTTENQELRRQLAALCDRDDKARAAAENADRITTLARPTGPDPGGPT